MVQAIVDRRHWNVGHSKLGNCDVMRQRRESGDGRRETGNGKRETIDGKRETGDVVTGSAVCPTVPPSYCATVWYHVSPFTFHVYSHLPPLAVKQS